MCDPMSALLAATVVTAGGQIVGGIQQNAIAGANARQFESDRRVEAALGARREAAVRREFRQRAGLQRAQLAAAGVTLDSATSLDLGRDLGEQGALEVWGARLDSTGRQARLTNAARLARAEGRMALLGGFTAAAGTALTAGPRLWPGLQGAG